MNDGKKWAGFEPYKTMADAINLGGDLDELLTNFFNNETIPYEVKELIAWNFGGMKMTTQWGYTHFQNETLRTFISRAILTGETIPYLADNPNLKWEEISDLLSLGNQFDAGDMKDVLVLALCESEIDHSALIKKAFYTLDSSKVSLASFVPWARVHFNLGEAIPDSWVLRFLEGRPSA